MALQAQLEQLVLLAHRGYKVKKEILDRQVLE
jgi:hypothetical protein